MNFVWITDNNLQELRVVLELAETLSQTALTSTVVSYMGDVMRTLYRGSLVVGLLFAFIVSASAAAQSTFAPYEVIEAGAALQTAYGIRATIQTPSSQESDITGVLSDPVSGRVYQARSSGDLLVIETQPPTGTGTLELGLVDHRNILMTLSPDRRYLYLAEHRHSPTRLELIVVDTALLEKVDTLTQEYECPYGGEEGGGCVFLAMEAGPQDRLYLLFHASRNYGTDDFIGEILVMDLRSGQLLERVLLPDNNAYYDLAINDETMFVSSYARNQSGMILRRFDIADPVPELEHARLTEVYEHKQLMVAPDGTYLITYASSWFHGTPFQDIRRYDAESLALERTIHPPEGAGAFVIATIASDGSEIVASLDDRANPTVIAYDAETGQPRRTGRLDPTKHYQYYGLVPLQNREIGHIWPGSLQVHTPSDFVLTCSVIYAGYCGSPIRDDFSDPITGWPNIDTDHLVVEYDRDSYRINHRGPNQWIAVTRGDRWYKGGSLSVRTWRTEGDGIGGVALGSDSSGDEFYTLEIIPTLRRWAIFRFRDNQWQLLDSEVSDAVRQGLNESNTLQLVTDNYGYVEFRINDVKITRLSAMPTGFVGLSVGSFEDEVDWRFDDYYFVPEGCPAGRSSRHADLVKILQPGEPPSPHLFSRPEAPWD